MNKLNPIQDKVFLSTRAQNMRGAGIQIQHNHIRQRGGWGLKLLLNKLKE